MLLISFQTSGSLRTGPGEGCGFKEGGRAECVGQEGRGALPSVSIVQSFNLSARCHCFCQGPELSLWPTCHLESDFMLPGHGFLAPSRFSPAWMLTQHPSLSLPGWRGEGRPPGLRGLTSRTARCSVHKQGGSLTTLKGSSFLRCCEKPSPGCGIISVGFNQEYFEDLSTIHRKLQSVVSGQAFSY